MESVIWSVSVCLSVVTEEGCHMLAKRFRIKILFWLASATAEDKQWMYLATQHRPLKIHTVTSNHRQFLEGQRLWPWGQGTVQNLDSGLQTQQWTQYLGLEFRLSGVNGHSRLQNLLLKFTHCHYTD